MLRGRNQVGKNYFFSLLKTTILQLDSQLLKKAVLYLLSKFNKSFSLTDIRFFNLRTYMVNLISKKGKAGAKAKAKH